MTTFSTLARGDQPVASYEPILELGRGGMGVVVLARATGIGGFERLVVVKRLHRHMLSEELAVRRFLDEAKTVASVHHANVVGIHQVGEDEEGLFLVLDYVEGASLDEVVDRAGLKGRTIPAEIVLRIALDALAGLHAAHQATDAVGRALGILHRDVSLQNVLIGKDGVARLADFGIAKSAVASVSTDTRYLVGKLLYLPREYLKREPVGPTLDVYALGLTLWIALAGRDPWPEGSEGQLVAQILEGVPSLSSSGVTVAPQVERIVMRACALDPADRFQSARDMADAIEAVGRDTGWIASHGEVAQFLDGLLASDLAKRRERIAEALASQDDRVTHTALPLVVERARGSETDTTWGGTPDGLTTLPMSRPPWARLLIGGILLAGAGAAGWNLTRPTPALESNDTESDAMPVASTDRRTGIASPTVVAAPSASARDAGPAPTHPTTTAVRSSPAPLAREARPLPPERTPPPPPAAPVAPTAALPTAPTTPPTAPTAAEPTAPGISKSNPYR